MITVMFTIEKNGGPVHELEAEIAGGEEINEESVVEELRALIIRWSTTWLQYPGTKVSLRSTSLI